MKCFYQYTSRRGNEVWGNLVMSNINIQDNIIKFCRSAFGKRYKNMWIYPVYFDDKYFKYTDKFFSEVGVLLLPKISNVKSEMKRVGIKSSKDSRADALIYFLAKKDLDENEKRNVKPKAIVVKGLRFADKSKKNKYINKIISVDEVVDF